MKKLIFLLSVALVISAFGVTEQITLWKNGDDGVASYRIPAMCLAPDGKTLVAVCDARQKHKGDVNTKQPINIVCRRSTDGGKTWTDSEKVWDWPWTDNEHWAGSDPSLIVDEQTKTIFLFFNVWESVKASGYYQYYVQSSTDNGATWSCPQNITESIKPQGWAERGFIFITSGSGCQMKDGTLLHTLVWVGNSVALFGSTDHGETWKPYGNPTPERGDECKVVELSDGTLMINARRSCGQREIFTSKDKGVTWEHRSDKTLLDPACNAQLMKAGKMLLFSNCNSTGRSNLYVRTSFDEGQTWNEGVCVEPGGAAYSDIALMKNRKLGVIFEKNTPEYSSICFCTLAPTEFTKK